MKDDLTAEEAEVYPERIREAAGRLNTALFHEQATRHLPPSDPIREAALQEWRCARAVAGEWDQ